MGRCLIIAGFIAVWLTGVQAAGSSQAGGPSPYSAEQVVTFGKQVEHALAAQHAYVAIVARKGRAGDELPKGFEYTHIGIAVYSTIKLRDGRELPGYAIHSLYQKPTDTARSYLISDFPVDFFSGVAELKAGVLIPNTELQQRLWQIMQSDIPQKLHNPRYSIIANPYQTRFQNCTSHTLDILVAAIYQTENIQQIKANERAYFKAQEVRVNPLKLLLGTVFVPDIALSDQDEHVVTATYETITRFLVENHLVRQQLTLMPAAIAF
ncbi:MAG: DUF2145 domain-containing protein [Gammaproteobacteria bacterium]|nr:DUF2145 domain-containing protein [Gammaproteobacteria bacterium]